jgi:hypothetical protein
VRAYEVKKQKSKTKEEFRAENRKLKATLKRREMENDYLIKKILNINATLEETKVILEKFRVINRVTTQRLYDISEELLKDSTYHSNSKEN